MHVHSAHLHARTRVFPPLDRGWEIEKLATKRIEDHARWYEEYYAEGNKTPPRNECRDNNDQSSLPDVRRGQLCKLTYQKLSFMDSLRRVQNFRHGNGTYSRIMCCRQCGLFVRWELPYRKNKSFKIFNHATIPPPPPLLHATVKAERDALNMMTTVTKTKRPWASGHCFLLLSCIFCIVLFLCLHVSFDIFFFFVNITVFSSCFFLVSFIYGISRFWARSLLGSCVNKFAKPAHPHPNITD